ncbi:MAG: PA4642 family protein [Marinobacter sp.]|uniref:PA4642 family protein n=1 Tax=Marinobacter sp. TaxID=50741 RepID=UPI00299D6351|nr:PA4642 family protein [Marinobacter sp.]MDX1634135.1 PA4642 family protein [Marinobacter sp.]
MSGPEKPKVIGEEWGDERVKSFLFISPYDARINADFHVLIKAYQAMRAGDFERFLGFFTEAGRDINAVNEDGQTILDHVLEHRRSVPYAEALRAAGGKTAAEAGKG